MGGKSKAQTAQRQSAPAPVKNSPEKPPPSIATVKASLPTLAEARKWVARNDLSLICAGIGAAAIAWAVTLGAKTNAASFNQKWIISTALLFAIAGGFWGTRRSERVQTIGVGCVIAFFAGLLLYDGLIDVYWQEHYTYGARLAATVAGAEVLGFALLPSIVRDQRKKNFLWLMLWLWGIGWILYFEVAPKEMQINSPSLDDFSAFPIVLYVSSGLIAIGQVIRGETNNAPRQPQVARSHWANGARKNWASVNLDED